MPAGQERRKLRRLCLIGVAGVVCVLLLAAAAVASPRVALRAGFSPYRLGSGTTVSIDLRVLTPRSALPPPATTIELLFPAGLGVADSGLGLESCDPAKLEARDPGACPPDSVLGRGSGVVEFEGDPGQLFYEPIYTTIFAGPILPGGELTLLFYETVYANPAWDTILLEGGLLPARPPFGGRLQVRIPLVPSITGYATFTDLHSTLGPANITYRRRTRGGWVSYKPQGIQIPPRCGRGGFAFGAEVTWQDGTSSSARTRLKCPR